MACGECGRAGGIGGEHSIFMFKLSGLPQSRATFSVVPVIERTWMYWIVFAVGVLAQWSITCSQSKQ